ncbi:MAG: 3-phosphoshikimate 1-carboxyvinyltransferase [Candidatus Dadabacteria bacterium]|nr:3-phosphoshikimate 1-carboxyvinyltransferase [Candidatus Dadabacteria bacterium]
MSGKTTITIAGKGGPVRGTVTVPGDKSISHRALMIGSLARGRTEITGLADGADVASTAAALRALGATIETSAGKTSVRCEKLIRPPGAIDAGNSGTTARLLAGVLSAQPFESIITGDRYLKKRPMERVITPLSLMGASISSEGGRLPLRIKGGKLSAIRYRMPVASAQVKSAIALAALFADGDTTIVEPAKTRDHTEIMLKHFGARITTAGAEVTVGGEGAEHLRGTEVEIPGDISSAIFLVAAALINPYPFIRVRNVGVNPTRTGAIDILRKMGADIRLFDQRNWGGEPVEDIVVANIQQGQISKQLNGIEIGGSEVPAAIDELPAIAAVACFARGTTVISGAGELRVKESDRISAMTEGLRNLGAKVEETPDGMRIEGGVPLRGGTVNSAGDHRVAMALAVAATGAEGESRIEDADCVAISFPEFFQTLENLRGGK